MVVVAAVPITPAISTCISMSASIVSAAREATSASREVALCVSPASTCADYPGAVRTRAYDTTAAVGAVVDSCSALGMNCADLTAGGEVRLVPALGRDAGSFARGVHCFCA